MNANRMTLTRTRKRLAMARRGHLLMKHKLEELIHLFQMEVARYGDALQDVEARLQETYAAYLMGKGMPRAGGLLAAPGPRLRTTVHPGTEHLLNLEVPAVSADVAVEQPPYGLLDTSADLDRSVVLLHELIPLLLGLAQRQRRIELLVREIETTRRRVAALEYVLVPRLVQEARLIQMKLDEMERANVSRLMRIKAVIRKEV